MFSKPTLQTLKTDHTSRVSRCTVCQRQRRLDNNIPDRPEGHHIPDPYYRPEPPRKYQQQTRYPNNEWYNQAKSQAYANRDYPRRRGKDRHQRPQTKTI